MAARKSPSSGPVKYAVVGLGYFAQVAVLPGFRQAKNSRLVAFVSDDPAKQRVLARKYGVDKGIAKPEIVVYEKAFHGRSIATM